MRAYLDAQLKIQVHFLMLIATGSVFALGVALFVFDFFRYPIAFADPAREEEDASLASVPR